MSSDRIIYETVKQVSERQAAAPMHEFNMSILLVFRAEADCSASKYMANTPGIAGVWVPDSSGRDALHLAVRQCLGLPWPSPAIQRG